MSESIATAKSRVRQRLALIGLFAIFFVPILVAWWMNAKSDHWRPSATINEGTLIIPTRPIVAAGLTHFDGGAYESGFFENVWTLVLIDSSACKDAACEAKMVATRQARLALGKDMNRLQRLYATVRIPEPVDLNTLQQAHPGLNIARVTPQWLEPFKVSADGSAQASGIYLVDPEGRLMMHYSEGADAEGILKDLQRLLKISKIG